MNKNYYTKTEKNINGYYALLNSAIDKVEQAIDHISYGEESIDYDTGKVINNNIINQLNDIIYKLEYIKDLVPMEPYLEKV